MLYTFQLRKNQSRFVYYNWVKLYTYIPIIHVTTKQEFYCNKLLVISVAHYMNNSVGYKKHNEENRIAWILLYPTEGLQLNTNYVV